MLENQEIYIGIFLKIHHDLKKQLEIQKTPTSRREIFLKSEIDLKWQINFTGKKKFK